MITVTQSENKGKSYTVTLSNKNVIKLSEYIVFRYSIFPEKQFPEKSWRQILHDADHHACYEKLLRLLSIKAHTEFEITTKLTRAGFSKAPVNAAIKKAKSINLINDDYFAKTFFEERRSSGRYGKLKIVHDLKRRGIRFELIQKVFPDADANYHEENQIEFENAMKLGHVKMKSLSREKDSMKRKSKLLRYLATRGFTSDICYQVINQLESEHAD